MSTPLALETGNSAHFINDIVFHLKCDLGFLSYGLPVCTTPPPQLFSEILILCVYCIVKKRNKSFL